MSRIRAAAARARARLPAVRTLARPGGRIRAAEGLLLEADGPAAPIGALVAVPARTGPQGARGRLAEVVGFREGQLLLMALDRGAAEPGAAIWLKSRAADVPCGSALLGRVTGAMGEPLDGLGAPRGAIRWPLEGRPLPPLARGDVREPMPTGVRAIDALLTLGKGQRVGLIAGSGVGKSVLLQQLVRGARAECVVVALIGERGREIAAFLDALAPEARARTHVIAVPADAAAPARLRGCLAAFASAECLRASGRHVLLLVDSLTRVAQAGREIGLATGEPAGLRGYPPSAIGLIPRLVERAGIDLGSGGAITALMTVLVDGDDTLADPVGDAARGVLDGHLLLDRGIAARGRFPAIDLAHSVSRTMGACVPPAQMQAAAAFRRDHALAEANADLLAMGAYARGQDPALDRALDLRDAMERLLAQPRDQLVGFEAAQAALLETWGRA